MHTGHYHGLMSRAVGFIVLVYGLAIIAAALLRQFQLHGVHDIDAVLASVPLLIGVSYVYLANLLLRLKYNAWLTVTLLSVGECMINGLEIATGGYHHHPFIAFVRAALPLAVFIMLILSRHRFKVRSDARTFTDAVRISLVILLIAYIYGVAGFCLLDQKDFHQEISLTTAMHQTIDQFGLTTKVVTPHTHRAVLFVDSLSAISIGAGAYVVLSFFQPLRMRFVNQSKRREKAEKMLQQFPADIDDFFKLWPHDKQYYFDSSGQAGLAYHVTRGVALIVGDPFGNPQYFTLMLDHFEELCFVNDWTPCFIHVSDQNLSIYRQRGYTLQKVGEEAVLDLKMFNEAAARKYFRQIQNRFDKLGYSVELTKPPHSQGLMQRLRIISNQWLEKPGRVERRFMLGYFDEPYLQHCRLGLLKDKEHHVQGFINLVPTYPRSTANYDLLRCAKIVPGNSNDYLLMGVLAKLNAEEVQQFNLGFSPLSGLDEKAEDFNIIDSTIRFVYSNGDRIYSFSGLRRFKEKYNPAWHSRYIAYRGGIAGFTRGVAALNRTMRVKK